MSLIDNYEKRILDVYENRPRTLLRTLLVIFVLLPIGLLFIWLLDKLILDWVISDWLSAWIEYWGRKHSPKN